MPERLNDWSDGIEAPGFSWHAVKDKAGNTIAYKIHTGPFGKEQVDAWRDALKDFNVLWVGVTAPHEILDQREKERGDRKIGEARWQAEHVHKGVDYDLMIDTNEKSIDENREISEHMNI